MSTIKNSILEINFISKIETIIIIKRGNYYMNIGERITTLRKANKLNQKELSEKN